MAVEIEALKKQLAEDKINEPAEKSKNPRPAQSETKINEPAEKSKDPTLPDQEETKITNFDVVALAARARPNNTKWAKTYIGHSYANTAVSEAGNALPGVVIVKGGDVIGISENEVYTMGNDGTSCKVLTINNLSITSTRDLPTLGRLRSSVTLVADQFILAIGGQKYVTITTNTVSCLDLHASNPQWQDLPRLNDCREFVSVIYMQGKVYAICGVADGHLTNMIERLDFVSSARPSLDWQIIKPAKNALLTPRRFSGVAQLNDDQFAILGGEDGDGKQGDITTTDHKCDTLKRRVSSEYFWFTCYNNQTAMVQEDTIAAVVSTGRGYHLIKWKIGDDTVTDVKKLD